MYQRETSLPAYWEAKISLNRKQQLVLGAIKALGICNDRQLVEHLGWPINCITPRRLELQTLGKVREFRKQKDPVTKRQTSYWVCTLITEQTKLF